MYDKFHINMSLRKNGFFTPRLQPGEQKRLKTKRLQPLKGLNAKATKNAEIDNHRAKAPVKKMNALNCAIKRGICCTPIKGSGYRMSGYLFNSTLGFVEDASPFPERGWPTQEVGGLFFILNLVFLLIKSRFSSLPIKIGTGALQKGDEEETKSFLSIKTDIHKINSQLWKKTESRIKNHSVER